MFEMVIFYLLAAVAVGAGVGVIAQRSAVRSALFLLVNFCSLAGLYILLNAQFVALVQVIVYAGAVVVLFLFIVMLLGLDRESTPSSVAQKGVPKGGRPFRWLAGALSGALLLAAVIWALLAPASAPAPAAAAPHSVRELGAALMTGYAIPFEMASVVLLVAIVGAVVLAKKKLER